MRCRPANLRDVVPHHRAVDVVRSTLEHELRHLERLHNPERFAMREVVEHQPGDRQRPQVLQTRRSGQVL